MNHVPVGSGIRALHVRTGAPALCARVATWLSDHQVQTVTCDDAFDAVARLIQQPESMPDIVLVGLDWLADDDFSLFAFLHDTWPSAAVVTYARETLRRNFTPHPTAIDCQTPDELAGVLANPPTAIIGAAQTALTNDRETSPTPNTTAALDPPPANQPPKLPIAPELPPLRPVTTTQSADNTRTQRRSPLRSVTRPADLLTPEELAALLQKDFR